MVSHGAFLRADGSTRLCCMAFDGRAGRQFCLQLALALSLLLCACGEKKNASETAQQMIGENLTALTDAIGKPNNESYASSCLGDGEDGELSYDGFTVYTYRAPDGAETVYDVIEQK